MNGTMDLADLRIFKTVVEEGGIVKAARKLHRVQSSITTRIRQLELMVEALQMDRLRGHNGSAEHPVLLTSGSNL